VTLVIAVVAIVVAVASYLTWMAGRLDRLAVRVEAAASALDAQLVRRAAVAVELAGPDRPQLQAAARLALDEAASGGDRSAVESELSRALRAAPEVAAVDEMAIAARKVMLGRQFHNDAVRDLLALRRRWLVRLLHLYGRARAPAYVEFDADEPGG
jgi:hypothetical protein